MDNMRMMDITEPYRTKADKMRVLERAGVARADIARFLGVRYQQVRNTLEGDKRTGYAPDLDIMLLDSIMGEDNAAPQIEFRELVILEDENIAIPTDMLEDFLERDEKLYALQLDDGIFISNAKGMAKRARQGLNG